MPGGHIQHTHIDRLAVDDADIGLGQQVSLVLIPEGQDIVAVRDVSDLERAIGVAAADVDGVVVAAGVDQRDQRLVDILDDVACPGRRRWSARPTCGA